MRDCQIRTKWNKKSCRFRVPGRRPSITQRRQGHKFGYAQLSASGEGAAIKIPAKTVVKMRVAKACKDAIVPGKK